MYIPILKVKRAEIDAVSDLDRKIKEIIMPLFEFIIPFHEQISPQKAQQKFLRALPKHLTDLQNVQKECFVDIRLLDKIIQGKTLKQIMEYNNSFLFPLINTIPIFEINPPTATHKTILNHYQDKICIRITKLDIQQQEFLERVEQFTKKYNLKPSNIDIILDFEYVETDELDEKTYDLIKKLFQLHPWRKIVFGAGAFPKDLSHIKTNTEEEQIRFDYLLWKKIQEQFEKHIIFADYTIQHPLQSHLGAYTPSSSIRYALENKWLIQRGSKPKKGEGRTQYVAHAKLLVQDKNRYYGKNHCKGDKYIMGKSKEPLSGKAYTGNPTTWLRTGICHHITLTARQVAN